MPGYHEDDWEKDGIKNLEIGLRFKKGIHIKFIIKRMF